MRVCVGCGCADLYPVSTVIGGEYGQLHVGRVDAVVFGPRRQKANGLVCAKCGLLGWYVDDPAKYAPRDP